MPVFVSYERTDQNAATAVVSALERLHVKAYLDLPDPTLNRGENATAAILAGIERCTHVLTIVSEATVKSWWVPFEVGAATRGDKRIATLHRDQSYLPDYLKVWPVLRQADLPAFARRYFQDTTTARDFSIAESLQKSLSNATAFHASLKRDLGQL